MGDMRVDAPLDRLSIDVLGPLSKTSRGNQTSLLWQMLSQNGLRYMQFLTKLLKTCAHKILNEFNGRSGCPIDLHSDQGRNFEGNIFKQLRKLLEIRKIRLLHDTHRRMDKSSVSIEPL